MRYKMKTPPIKTAEQKLKEISDYVNSYYREHRRNESEEMIEALDLCCAIKHIVNSL